MKRYAKAILCFCFAALMVFTPLVSHAAEDAASLTSEASSPASQAGETAYDPATAVNLDLDYVPISAGHLHSGIIKDDSTLWTSGYNTYGQLGNGTEDDSLEYVYSMSDVSAVYAGYFTTLVLDKRKVLYGFGSNEAYAFSADEAVEKSNKPIEIMNDVVSAALGQYHTAAVTTDGTLLMWGWNSKGQLGIQPDASQIVTEPTPVLRNVRKVALGLEHTLALTVDDKLYTTGDNTYGQLGNGTYNNGTGFAEVWSGVKDIAATDFGTILLQHDGSVYVCGYNAYSELGDGSTSNILQFTKIMDNVRSIYAHAKGAAAIDNDGALWAWGYNDYGQLGVEPQSPRTKIAEDISFVSIGGGHIMFLKNDGEVEALGNNEKGQFGTGENYDINADAAVIMQNVPTVEQEKSDSPALSSEIVVIILVGIILLAVLVITFLLLGRKSKKPARNKKPAKIKQEKTPPEKDIVKRAKKLKTETPEELIDEIQEEAAATEEAEEIADEDAEADEIEVSEEAGDDE